MLKIHQGRRKQSQSFELWNERWPVAKRKGRKNVESSTQLHHIEKIKHEKLLLRIITCNSVNILMPFLYCVKDTMRQVP